MSRKKFERLELSVKLDVPAGSNASECMEYVRSAILTMGGGRQPDDTFFDTEQLGVTVSLKRKETTYA